MHLLRLRPSDAGEFRTSIGKDFLERLRKIDRDEKALAHVQKLSNAGRSTSNLLRPRSVTPPTAIRFSLRCFFGWHRQPCALASRELNDVFHNLRALHFLLRSWILAKIDSQVSSRDLL